MADYICPMCDTSVSRTDRACPKCGCPIDFIRDFQANKKTNTSEITPVQTDDFLELPIIKPVQKAENSNIPSPVQEESKPDLSKCKGIANVEGVHEIVSEVYSKQAAYAELRHLQKEHPDTIYEIEEDGPDFSDYEL